LVLWDSVNSRNQVYVVTQNDSIYLFDGTNIPQKQGVHTPPEQHEPSQRRRNGRGLP
jgi:hypothetical protein